MFLLLAFSIGLASSPVLEIPAKQLEIASLYQEAIEEPEAFLFTPPPGWMAADPAVLPPSVKAMVIGKRNTLYPPSINIGMESFEGSLKSYLKNIKLINETQNATWKDLGQISTESGQASLSSVDMTTEWGDVRLMHAIILRYGTAYIMTCASLKEEFSIHYKDFFQTMRSIKINRDVYESVTDSESRAKLMNQTKTLKNRWIEVWEPFQKERLDTPLNRVKRECFESPAFQKSWSMFAENLDKDFGALGPRWKSAMLAKAKKELGVCEE